SFNYVVLCIVFFFFQAEDGIRDFHVTGVQTCALPICEMKELLTSKFRGSMKGRTMYVVPFCMGPMDSPLAKIGVQLTDSAYVVRSEERRVGKECSSRWSPEHYI